MFMLVWGKKKKKSNLESSASCPLWSQNRDSFWDLGRILKVKATDDTLGHLGCVARLTYYPLFNVVYDSLKCHFKKSGLKTKTKPSYDCDTSVGVSDCDSTETPWE